MEIFGLVGLFLFVTCIILPWVNNSNIRTLRERVDLLETRVKMLQGSPVRPQAAEPVAAPVPQPRQQKPQEQAPAAPVIPQTPPEVVAARTAAAEAYLAAQENILAGDTSRTLEQQFGGKAFVWLGGVALALAGFFMVKYSIETGLLSPEVRVVLGLIFGVALVGGGHWIRSKPMATSARIGQALAGAGIADLYACLFAATSLYHFIPSVVGFAGMAAVTAVAVVLSLRHGVPIAVLGLVGGFLTPALIGSTHPSAALLFLYLYFVLAGLMLVIRGQNWWPLAVPAVLGAFLWVVAWLFGGNFVPGDAFWLGLFLMAISATVAVALRPEDGEETSISFAPTSLMSYLTMGGAVVLMGVTAVHSGFGMMEWGLFGLLSLGGIGLAYFDQKLYGLVPWISLAVNAVMFMAWNSAAPQDFALVLVLFAVMYVASGWVLQFYSSKPVLWAGLTGAASVGYYLIGYFQLHATPLVADMPRFWGCLALLLAALSVVALQNVMKRVKDSHPQKQYLLAAYAAIATAFISIGLTIELQYDFLPVALAGEVLALAWINTRVNIHGLRYIAGVLAASFGVLLLPQLGLLIQLAAYGLVDEALSFHVGDAVVKWPAFQLGLPALFFAGSGYLLRLREEIDRFVQVLEGAAIALLALMAYYLTRQAFHPGEDALFVRESFVERGTITNIMFLFGLACVWGARRYGREAVFSGGAALIGFALFRIVYFDFIICNPLWAHQAVGPWPIFNALLLTYGLPILWTWKAEEEIGGAGKLKWSRFRYGVAFLLAFTLASLEVRQLYHGTYLDGTATGSAEIYTYSAVWLLFGMGLLLLGTIRQDKMTRIASLGVLLLTVGKVFLYDASELTGLWRVFSFFGLGLSLLALSWFYSRFVLKPEK